MLTYAVETTQSSVAKTQDKGSRQILGLDLIRFASALLVLGFHLAWLNRMYHRGSQQNYSFGYLDRFTRSGWIGVDIFFVLSGFVIAYSAARSSPLKFAESRFLRLYPAVWICSTVTLLALFLSAEFHPYLVKLWLLALFLFPTAQYIDSSYWTLGIELSFYALIFVLLSLQWFRHLAAVLTAWAAVSMTFLLCRYLTVRFAEKPLQQQLRTLFTAMRGRGTEPAATLP